MSRTREVILRPTVKAHLREEVAAALETIQRDLYEHHMGEGVLHGSSFVLVRGRCALAELEMAVAALEEVHEAAQARSLSGAENRLAGRVERCCPGCGRRWRRWPGRSMAERRERTMP